MRSDFGPKRPPNCKFSAAMCPGKCGHVFFWALLAPGSGGDLFFELFFDYFSVSWKPIFFLLIQAYFPFSAHIPGLTRPCISQVKTKPTSKLNVFLNIHTQILGDRQVTVHGLRWLPALPRNFQVFLRNQLFRRNEASPNNTSICAVAMTRPTSHPSFHPKLAFAL